MSESLKDVAERTLRRLMESAGSTRASAEEALRHATAAERMVRVLRTLHDLEALEDGDGAQ